VNTEIRNYQIIQIRTMKKLINLSLIIIVFTFLFSCSAQIPIAKQAALNNKTYEVEYLFEHDGCKVYRFTDHGDYIYFTNCTGEVSKMKGDSTESRVVNVIKADTYK
jgi:hypothetical protein